MRYAPTLRSTRTITRNKQPEGRATMTIARMEDAHIATTSFFTMAPYTYNIGTAPGTYTIVVKTSHQEYEALLEIN